MADIDKTLSIAAPLARVWDALTDAADIAQWMMDPHAAVTLAVGGAYRFFDGQTTGVFIHIDPPHRLAYTWRQDTWAADWPDSEVIWELAASGQGTTVRLIHRSFPNDDERDSHDTGWDDYFLLPMREWLELNS